MNSRLSICFLLIAVIFALPLFADMPTGPGPCQAHQTSSGMICDDAPQQGQGTSAGWAAVGIASLLVVIYYAWLLL